MKAKVQAPGSCGELVQGTIKEQNFLITCPIDLYSTVEVGPAPKHPRMAAGVKTLAAVAKTAEYLAVAGKSFEVVVRSELPMGKGMASSSADISAACQATAATLGKLLTVDEIADIALSIEPTDGIFYTGVVMFDHVKGELRRQLGAPPPMRIAVFDAGGEVDTLGFNQRTDLAGLNRKKEEAVAAAAELVIRGLAANDCSLIGRGATLSALANQAILYKPCLQTLAELVPALGAVGLNVAHSGTVLGILFAEKDSWRIPAAVAVVRKVCPDIEYLHTVRFISGGLTLQYGGMPDGKNTGSWRQSL
ncbi:Hypothetical protein LUCI_2065 [Lucifera butyrica]|uniref:GHMP kinase N-terminal domain-containing protein n=1 Tax=Lucifera butyrica TaxID=1351585 RepID=A0A498RCE7_9FIRM|nr:GHMP kinase [Lucifera butyrica]VBB06828.1 Hypothetical protein LUCI_2065 [Lucifera butyrica]